MGSFLLAPEPALGRITAYTEVKVIIVRVGSGGLVENPGGSNHCPSRWLVPNRVAKKARFDLVRAEQPLHTSVFIQHQRAHEMPVPRLVEAVRSTAEDPEA